MPSKSVGGRKLAGGFDSPSASAWRDEEEGWSLSDSTPRIR